MPVEAKRRPPVLFTKEQIAEDVVPTHEGSCKKRPITKDMIVANTRELDWARSVIGLPGKPNLKDVNQAYRILEKYHV